MSLLVHVFVLEEDGRRQILDPTAPGGDLAGFERWRTLVWGAEPVRALGARFFPVLATGDLTVAPGDVLDFLRECDLFRTNIPAIVPTDDPHHSHECFERRVSERLTNIERAAAHALEIGGGVLVW